jgi:hypothetical protein
MAGSIGRMMVAPSSPENLICKLLDIDLLVVDNALGLFNFYRLTLTVRPIAGDDSLLRSIWLVNARTCAKTRVMAVHERGKIL